MTGSSSMWVKPMSFVYADSSSASSRYVSERLSSSGFGRQEPRWTS